MKPKEFLLNEPTPVQETDLLGRRGTGIFPCQAIHDMLRSKDIVTTVEITPDQIQPASIDLRLGNFAYPVDVSFLPGKDKTVIEKMTDFDEGVDSFKIDLRNGAVLEKGKVYVVPLLEAVNLRAEVEAFANPKSSTGRLDILTRLISDRATVFDQLAKGYQGQLYLEVAPQSFSVFVRTGDILKIYEIMYYGA